MVRTAIFLQLPIDPIDYDKLGCIWRGKLLLFTSYVWGTRHAGMNGQRVTSAIACIHRSLGFSEHCSHKANGCDPDCLHSNSDSLSPAPFNCLNYSDDFGSAEPTFQRATLSFNTLGSLLSELGFTEATDKAISPCKVLTYLGIEFSTS